MNDRAHDFFHSEKYLLKGSGEVAQQSAASMAPAFVTGLQPDAFDVDSELPVPDFEEPEKAAELEGHTLSVNGTPKMESFLNSYSSYGSASSEMSVRTFAKQRQRKQLCRERLNLFLKDHNFSKDVCEPRLPKFSCASFGKEILYPIHVAASLGDGQMVRLLAKAGADLQQTTSKGRTAADLACERDVQGSHRDVLDLLRGTFKTMALREFVSIMHGCS